MALVQRWVDSGDREGIGEYAGWRMWETRVRDARVGYSLPANGPLPLAKIRNCKFSPRNQEVSLWRDHRLDEDPTISMEIEGSIFRQVVVHCISVSQAPVTSNPWSCLFSRVSSSVYCARSASLRTDLRTPSRASRFIDVYTGKDTSWIWPNKSMAFVYLCLDISRRHSSPSLMSFLWWP